MKEWDRTQVQNAPCPVSNWNGAFVILGIRNHKSPPSLPTQLLPPVCLKPVSNVACLPVGGEAQVIPVGFLSVAQDVWEGQMEVEPNTRQINGQECLGFQIGKGHTSLGIRTTSPPGSLPCLGGMKGSGWGRVGRPALQMGVACTQMSHRVPTTTKLEG